MTIDSERRALSTWGVVLDGPFGPPWLQAQGRELAWTFRLKLIGVTTTAGASEATSEAFLAACTQAGVAAEVAGHEAWPTRKRGAVNAPFDTLMVAPPSAGSRVFPWRQTPLDALMQRASCPIWVATPTSGIPTAITAAYNGQATAVHAVHHAACTAHSWALPVDLLVVEEGKQVDDHDLLIARQELLVRDVREREAQYRTGAVLTQLLQATSPDHLLMVGRPHPRFLLGRLRQRTTDRLLAQALGPVVVCP